MGQLTAALYSNEPTITRQLVKIDPLAAGFYAFNGKSVLQFIPNQEKERICARFEEIREQNPLEWSAKELTPLEAYSSQ